MSHRVTVKTEMKDKGLVIQALNQAGIGFRDPGGNILQMTTGRFHKSHINLSSGEIVGDTDDVTQAELGLLRQYYAEAKFRKESAPEGVIVESRTVDQEGVIVLQCRTL